MLDEKSDNLEFQMISWYSNNTEDSDSDSDRIREAAINNNTHNDNNDKVKNCLPTEEC